MHKIITYLEKVFNYVFNILLIDFDCINFFKNLLQIKNRNLVWMRHKGLRLN